MAIWSFGPPSIYILPTPSVLFSSSSSAENLVLALSQSTLRWGAENRSRKCWADRGWKMLYLVISLVALPNVLIFPWIFGCLSVLGWRSRGSQVTIWGSFSCFVGVADGIGYLGPGDGRRSVECREGGRRGRQPPHGAGASPGELRGGGSRVPWAARNMSSGQA